MNYFYFKFAESLNKEYYFDRNRSGSSFEISCDGPTQSEEWEGGHRNLAGPSSKKTQKQKASSQPDPHSKPQTEACKALDWVMVSYIDVYWTLNEPVWKQSSLSISYLLKYNVTWSYDRTNTSDYFLKYHWSAADLLKTPHSVFIALVKSLARRRRAENFGKIRIYSPQYGGGGGGVPLVPLGTVPVDTSALRNGMTYACGAACARGQKCF